MPGLWGRAGGSAVASSRVLAGTELGSPTGTSPRACSARAGSTITR